MLIFNLRFLISICLKGIWSSAKAGVDLNSVIGNCFKRMMRPDSTSKRMVSLDSLPCLDLLVPTGAIKRTTHWSEKGACSWRDQSQAQQVCNGCWLSIVLNSLAVEWYDYQMAWLLNGHLLQTSPYSFFLALSFTSNNFHLGVND
jgi:hypothetical protein